MSAIFTTTTNVETLLYWLAFEQLLYQGLEKKHSCDMIWPELAIGLM